MTPFYPLPLIFCRVPVSNLSVSCPSLYGPASYFIRQRLLLALRPPLDICFRSCSSWGVLHVNIAHSPLTVHPSSFLLLFIIIVVLMHMWLLVLFSTGFSDHSTALLYLPIPGSHGVFFSSLICLQVGLLPLILLTPFDQQ